MAGDSIGGTRREKLRSSCDRCGTAKVKCDKEQPECGRCISHGIPCVYGVSRKMGKPPRRISLSQSRSDTVTTTQSSSESSSGGMLLDLELPGTGMNTWDPLDEDSNSHTFIDTLDAGESLNHELSIPMIPNLPLDYNDWAISDQTDVNIHFPFRSSQQSPMQGEDLADALGIKDLIPFDEWVARVEAAPQRNNPALNLLELLDSNYLRMSCGGLVVDVKNTIEHSETLAAVGPVSEEVVRKYIYSYLEGDWLFEPGTK